MEIPNYLTDDDKEKIRELAVYIAQSSVENIPAEGFMEERIYWYAVGIRIWTALSNEPYPSEELQAYIISPELTRTVEVVSSYYIALAALTFQAEGFIRAEAESQKIEFPFQNMLQLVYILVAEQIIDRLRLRLPENEWESPSGSQFKERARDSKKWLNGEMSHNLLLTKVDRWKKEDQKNLNGQIFIQKPACMYGIRWDDFCGNVFSKYQRDLPVYENYKDALIACQTYYSSFSAKFAFIGGQIRLYPGRGKAKG